MPDYGHDLRFGVFVTPSAARAAHILSLAEAADRAGIDLITFQDHPYQAKYLDTWTLLAVVAARTTRVRVAPNVANLPLRPPAMLARAVATLDILSGGRVELGLGAGAFAKGAAARGGPERGARESVAALGEAIDVMRAMWRPDGAVMYEGEHYTVRGAHAGPAPAHPVEIWLGAYRPRMLELTGAKADGWLPSLGYLTPEGLPELNAAIDTAAEAAGRRPDAIRRLLNLGALHGPSLAQAERLAELTLGQGFSTYILAADEAGEAERFAYEVAPLVRELVADERARP